MDTNEKRAEVFQWIRENKAHLEKFFPQTEITETLFIGASIAKSVALELNCKNYSLKRVETGTIDKAVVDLAQHTKNMRNVVIFVNGNSLYPSQPYKYRKHKHQHFTKHPKTIKNTRLYVHLYKRLAQALDPKLNITIVCGFVRLWKPLCDCKENVHFNISRQVKMYNYLETQLAVIFPNAMILRHRKFIRDMHTVFFKKQCKPTMDVCVRVYEMLLGGRDDDLVHFAGDNLWLVGHWLRYYLTNRSMDPTTHDGGIGYQRGISSIHGSA